jgi:hypothetical protein
VVVGDHDALMRLCWVDDQSPRLFLNRNGVHYFKNAGSAQSDRFGNPSFKTVVDQTIQIHDVVYGLHLNGMRRTKFRMLIEESLNVRSDSSIPGAGAAGAFPIARASGKRTR